MNLKALLKGVGVIAVAFALSIFATVSFAKDYEVPGAPTEYQSKKNPYTSAADIQEEKNSTVENAQTVMVKKGEGDSETPNAVAFDDKGWMSKRSDGQLFYIAMEGAGEDAEMEGYGPYSDAGMSEKKIWQIIAYIRTLAK